MRTPKVNVPPVPAGEDTAMYLAALTDQQVVGAYMNFFIAALGIPPDDAMTVELVRLRNAVAHSCEY